ncbi:MAG: site-specific DNA-methyltransferase, partial [Euryarchaeota archaeon]|nr:site-specific DNA-methyltransferase [Euryarchaeota archaeon]
MVRGKPKPTKREIVDYEHTDKTRKNNPPVGLVDPDSDPFNGKTRYAYDPHLDPQLVWSSKVERSKIDVANVSLHVHERIEPITIISAARKRDGGTRQVSLFESIDRKLPLREAIEFYKHENEWSNRLIAGDSLLVLNSLLSKESMAGQVQMIYFDPPYGIRYGSNFQPFVNKREVRDGKDDDLTQEPETVKAFRDTWELGIHSYLTYMRDRLLLAKQLLHESGSIFVQISDENVHHVREVLDEVFGADCFVVTFVVKKKGSQKSGLVDPVNDYVLWYARSPRESGKARFHPLFVKRELDDETLRRFYRVEMQ